MNVYDRYYKQLVGFHIYKVGFDDDEYGERFPLLYVRNTEGDELVLTVSCDEEGNAPGFLFIDLVGEEE